MLVLSRKKDQKITIENRKTKEKLSVMLVDLRKNQIKLGFDDNNNHFRILRNEIIQ